MTRIFPAFIFFTLLSCSHVEKTYQPDISELKSFFAQLDDSSLTKREFLLVDTVQVKWKDLFISTASHQKALPKQDIDFIAEQFDNTQTSVWTNTVFDSARLVSNTYIQNFYQKTDFVPVHYRFSYPYFSKDKKYCVLYYDYYCGNLCAEESIRLYKNDNGKWTLVKTLFSIVS